MCLRPNPITFSTISTGCTDPGSIAPSILRTPFSVTAQLFNGNGSAVSSGVNNVSLVSNGIGFEANPSNQNTNASGVVTFTGLTSPASASGTATLTVDATGVDAGNSGDITVTAAPVVSFFELVSRDNSGGQTTGGAAFPDVSSDGRFVAFQYEGSLVPADGNPRSDVYVYDRQNDTVELISRDASGTVGDNFSAQPSISADGRFVAFRSPATNLVPLDTNGVNDIFVFDRTNQTIERVSVNNSGDEANGSCSRPSISDDGRYVAFASSATNLDGAGFRGVFVYDRQNDTIVRASLNTSGNPVSGSGSGVALSGNGQVVAFSYSGVLDSSDTNGEDDIYVRDLVAGTTELVSKNGNGDIGDNESIEAAISQDGRFVAFSSAATNLVTPDSNGRYDVFVFDRTNDTIERVSQDNSGAIGNGSSFVPAISNDGRFVTFESNADNLVTGDTNTAQDIFLFDRNLSQIVRMSVNPNGTQADAGNQSSAISGDGGTVVFQTDSNILFTGDSDSGSDIIVVSNPPPTAP